MADERDKVLKKDEEKADVEAHKVHHVHDEGTEDEGPDVEAHKVHHKVHHKLEH
jgi:hypothetical protein